MKKFIKILTMFAMVLVLTTACSQKADTNSANQANQANQASSKDPGTAKDGNEQKIETASMNLVNAVNKGGYELLSTEELNSWIEQKKDMIIIDTMPAKSFDKNRIPGAVNAELPVKAEEVKPEQKEAFIKALGEDKNKTIVVYCGFVQCARSDVGANIAKEAGFTNVYRQPGGIVAWMDAGYTIEGSAATK
ncbi:MAG: rhodanese-like domain-containing protein [Finegoldia sp.]|nr:rhodanese-like domain-containing protein [Finegoldia sp.]